MSTKIPQKIIIGVLGLAINKQKQFFLTRREAPGRPEWHNMWQTPGGGLEFGESPEETLKREMMEELQVKVDIIHPQPIVKTSIWYKDETDMKQDTQIVLIIYLVDIKNQTPNFSGDDETNGGDWYDYDQISNLETLPLTDEIMEEAQKICKKYDLWSVLQ